MAKIYSISGTLEEWRQYYLQVYPNRRLSDESIERGLHSFAKMLGLRVSTFTPDKESDNAHAPISETSN
jgi:hypothetical protein